jgi:hypothetical protein
MFPAGIASLASGLHFGTHWELMIPSVTVRSCRSAINMISTFAGREAERNGLGIRFVAGLPGLVTETVAARRSRRRTAGWLPRTAVVRADRWLRR